MMRRWFPWWTVKNYWTLKLADYSPKKQQHPSSFGGCLTPKEKCQPAHSYVYLTALYKWMDETKDIPIASYKNMFFFQQDACFSCLFTYINVSPSIVIWKGNFWLQIFISDIIFLSFVKLHNIHKSTVFEFFSILIFDIFSLDVMDDWKKTVRYHWSQGSNLPSISLFNSSKM